MASLITNKLRALLLEGGIDLLNDTIKVMLVNTAYIPDKDHSYVSSITAATSKELDGTGYTSGFGGAGRKTLASKTVTQDDTNDLAYFDAADVTWTGIDAGTAAYAAIIKEVTADTDSPLLCVIDLSPDIVTNTGPFTIPWAADGLFSIT